MTKEELSAKIAKGEYKDCRRESGYSVSFRIGDMPASASKHGNECTALTIITTEISEDDYNKILKQALNTELENMKAQEKELTERINEL